MHYDFGSTSTTPKMQPPSSFWPVSLVDYAQILSAIATAAAVIVSLWITRRQDGERMRGSISQTLSYKEHQRLTDITLRLILINIGNRPINLDVVYFNFPGAKRRTGFREVQSEFVYLRDAFEKSDRHVPIQYGEALEFEVQIESAHLEHAGPGLKAKHYGFTVETVSGTKLTIPSAIDVRANLRVLKQSREHRTGPQ